MDASARFDCKREMKVVYTPSSTCDLCVSPDATNCEADINMDICFKDIVCLHVI